MTILKRFTFIFILALMLTGCDIPIEPEDGNKNDIETGSVEVSLSPETGVDAQTYHIEVDLETGDLGEVEYLYYQLSETNSYDDNNWIEADSCFLLCDYVLDIESEVDGEYYIHFKVVTDTETSYIVSDNTYTIENKAATLEIELDPATGEGAENYHIEIDFTSENVGTIESVYWQVLSTTTYNDNEWIEASSCFFLCDYVIDLANLNEGEYYVHFKVVTTETTKYFMTESPYVILHDDYTVTFESNGGRVINAVTVDRGSNVTEPFSPSKEGYHFNGWFTDLELTEEYNFQTVVSSDITLYAKWTELPTNTITFDLDGGLMDGTSMDAYTNTPINELPTPYKLGYRFVGWEFADELITYPFFVMDDVSLNAVYEAFLPHEALFNYYKSYTNDPTIIYHEYDNHIELVLEGVTETRYYDDGVLEFFYHANDYAFGISVNFCESTIHYEDTLGNIYERDFLSKTYEGNVTMADYELIEEYFVGILSFEGSDLQTALYDTFGVMYHYSDFNPNWDELLALEDNYYQTPKMEVIESLDVEILNDQLEGLYRVINYRIENNSEETVTYIRVNLELILESIDGSVTTNYSDYNTAFITLSPGESMTGTFNIYFGGDSISYSKTELYVADIRIDE